RPAPTTPPPQAEGCLRLLLDDLHADQPVAGLAIALRVALADAEERLQRVRVIHRAKDGVLAVQPGRWHMRNEELAAVGVPASIRHRQDTGPVMEQRQRARLVVELVAGAATPGARGIAALHHEVLDHTVEGR